MTIAIRSSVEYRGAGGKAPLRGGFTPLHFHPSGNRYIFILWDAETYAWAMG
jgi:hypothetical protein